MQTRSTSKRITVGLGICRHALAKLRDEFPLGCLPVAAARRWFAGNRHRLAFGRPNIYRITNSRIAYAVEDATRGRRAATHAGEESFYPIL